MAAEKDEHEETAAVEHHHHHHAPADPAHNGEVDEDNEEDDEEEGEPKLKYTRLTGSLASVYRGGDATSASMVAGDKMVRRISFGASAMLLHKLRDGRED